MGEILLEAASDDLVEPDTVRRLMRDLREVRMSKIRAGVAVLDAGGVVSLKGVGGMEVGESRAFIVGVIDGLRCEHENRTVLAFKLTGPQKDWRFAGAGTTRETGRR